MPSPPFFPRQSQLFRPGVMDDANSWRTQLPHHFSKLASLVVAHQAQTFAQLLRRLFFGFKRNRFEV